MPLIASTGKWMRIVRSALVVLALLVIVTVLWTSSIVSRIGASVAIVATLFLAWRAYECVLAMIERVAEIRRTRRKDSLRTP